MDPNLIFMRIEWPGCSSIEISGEGQVTVDGEDATAEEFALAFARIAQAWKDTVPTALPDGYSLTGCHLRGPIPIPMPYVPFACIPPVRAD
jgi:hypothetical protein